MKRAFHLLGILAVSSACSTKVPLDNPYDPRAPVDRQIRGEIIGSVVSDAVFDPDTLEFNITGVTPTGDQILDVDVLQEVNGQVVDFVAEVVAGTYRLTASAPNFAPTDRFGIVVSAGETVDVGILQLEAGRGTLSGTVIARSPPADDATPPLDTRITAIRLVQPFNPAGNTSACELPGAEEAVTVPIRGDGTFVATDLAAGPYLVTAERDGYVPALSAGSVDVEIGTVTNAGNLVLLRANQMLRITPASDPDAAPDGLATRNLDLSLNIAVPPLYNGMRLSEDPSFGDAALGDTDFGDDQTSLSWTLTPGEGVRELFVQFRAPTCAMSPVFSTDIVVDTTEPVVEPLTLVTGSSCTNDPHVALKVTGSDPCLTDSCAGLYQMRISIDGTYDDEQWVDYDGQHTLDLGTDGDKATLVTLRDRAGNSSSVATSTITVNSAGPQVTPPVVLFDEGAAIVHSLNVSLSFGVTDATQVEVGNASGLDGSAWQDLPITGRVDWRLDDGADSDRDVYVRFRDECGNTTQEYHETIPLDRSAYISGIVRLENPPTDHGGTDISVWRDAGSGIYVDTGETTTSGTDGAFYVSGLVAGTYRLDFSHTDYSSRSIANLTLTDGGELLLPEFTLLKARGNLQGTVTLQGETSHDGIRVEAAAGLVTFTDVNGDYLFTDLVVGQYLVSAENGAAYSPADASGLTTVQEGQTAVAPSIVLQPVPGSITGVAQREGVAVHTGIDVVASGVTVTGTEQASSMVTGSGGTFTLTGLTAGTYSLTLSTPSFATEEMTSLVLSPGEILDVGTTILEAATGGIAGQVELVGQTLHDGVRLALLESSVEVAATFSQADGSYSFADVAAGSYSIIATKTGFASADVPLVVVSPEEVEPVGLLSLSPQVGNVSLVGVSTATRETTVDITGEYEKAEFARFCENPAIQPPTGDPSLFTTGDCDWEPLAFAGGGPAFDPVTKTFSQTECPNPGDALAICDGKKTWWVKIRDTDNVESSWFALPVILDREPPTGHVVIEPFDTTLAGTTVNDGGAYYTRYLTASVLVVANEVRTGIAAGDAVSGISTAELYRTPSDGFPVTIGMTEGNRTLDSVGLEAGNDGPRTLYLVLTDRAGNASVTDLSSVTCPDPRVPGVPTDCDSIFQDDTAPTSLAYSINPTNPSVSMAVGDDWANSPLVQLGLDSTGGNPEDEGVEVEISNDPNFLGSVIQPLSDPETLVSWVLSPGEGQKWVYVKIRDAAGNWSARFEDFIDFDATPPNTPVLLPVGRYTNDNTPTLVFGSVSDALSYQIQLTDDPGFAGGGSVDIDVNQLATLGTTYTAATLGDATYYWRVRAIDAAGLASPFSPVDTFTVDIVLPAAPVMTAVATPTNDNTPTVTWSSVDDAVSYEVQVHSGTPGTPVGTITPAYTPSALTGNTTWYARARAIDAAGNESGWATEISFYVDIQAPTNPGLGTPADGALIASSSVLIDWDPAADTAVYVLQIDSAVAMSNPDEYQLLVTQKNVVLGDGAWTYRVGGIDEAGNASDISTAIKRTFTIDTTPPDVPTLTPQPQWVTTSTPTFDWSAETGATTYILQVDDNTYTTGNNTHTPGDTLDDGPHSWSVAAEDAAGNRSAFAPQQGFSVDANPPDAPTLIPVSDPTSNNQPTLAFSAVAGAVSYDVEWDIVSTFNSGPPFQHLENITNTSLTPTDALDDRVWFWQVTAYDAAGNPSSPSATGQFEVDTDPPDHPTLVSPADDAEIASSTVTFTWNTVSDAVNYQIDYSQDFGFATYVRTTVTAPSFTVTLEDDDWYWRVRSVDAAANGGDWGTAPERHVVVDTSAPATPVMTPVASPTQDDTPTLSWSSVAGATEYAVTLDGVTTIVAGTNFTPAPLSDDMHTWTVASRDDAGNQSADAPAQSFEVDADPPGQPVLIAFTPDPTNDPTPVVEWNAVAGADSYTVEWDTVSGFNSGNHGSSITTSAQSLIGPLDVEGTWYWRVTAHDDAGNSSSPSSADDFVVDTDPPNTPVLTLANGDDYVQTSVGVLVDITATAFEMQVAMDGTLDTEPWETFDAQFNADLDPAGDGEKTVSVRVRDAAHNQSLAVSASITVDGADPTIGTPLVGDGSSFVTTSDGATTVEVQCVDDVPDYELDLVVLSGAVEVYNGPYLDRVDVTLGATEGTTTITATCSDPAGNSATSAGVDVTRDHSPPDVTLFAIDDLEDANSTRDAVERTRSTSIAVAVNLSDPISGSADDIDVALAETAMACSLASYAYEVDHATETGIVLVIAPGDRTLPLYLCARDPAGNTTSNATATGNSFGLDTAGPSVPGLQLYDIDSNGFPMDSDHVELRWSKPVGTDLFGFDIERFVIGVDDEFGELTTVNNPSTQEWSDDVTATVGHEHQYRIRAFDDLNNTSGWSNVASAVPYLPITDVYYVAGANGIFYEFQPHPGTFSLNSQHEYESSGVGVYTNTLPDNLSTWTRPQPTTTQFNELLLMQTSNQTNNLVYLSTAELPLNRRKAVNSFVVIPDGSATQVTSIDIDSYGWVHFCFYDSVGMNLIYARNTGGPWGTMLLASSGNVGSSCSLAIDSNDKVHISYHDVSNGRGRYVTNATGGWSYYAIPGTNVGRYSSLAVDSNGVVHISYQDYFNLDLKYSSGTGGAWGTAVVDSAGSVGFRTSIAVDDNNKAHIIYGDASNSRVKYANNVSGWALAVIDTTGFPKTACKIAIDGYGKVHTAYDVLGGNLRYATNAGGSWVAVDVETGATGEGLGFALDSAGGPHVLYQESSEKDLIYSRLVGGVWTPEILDEAGDLGAMASLVIDADDVMHASYIAYDSVRYLRDVHIQNQPLRIQSGGEYSSIAISPDGATHIVHVDGQGLYHESNESGAWVRTLIELPDSVGGCAIAADAAGNLHVAYHEDSSAWDLRYAKRIGSSWTTETVDESTSNVGSYPALAIDSLGYVHITYLDGFLARIKHATNRFGGWSTDVIESSAIGRSSIAIDTATDRLHVSYATGSALRYATALASGGPFTWTNLDGMGAGEYNAITVDSSGAPTVAYYYGNITCLNVATAPSHLGPWTTRFLDNVGAVGEHVSLALGASGEVHISYYDAGTRDLKYATNASGSWPWRFVRLDTGEAGTYTSIVIDANGQPQISYKRDSGLYWIHDFQGMLTATTMQTTPF